MSKSTVVPWVEFFRQDGWYNDLFITYGGMYVINCLLAHKLIVTYTLVMLYC